MRRSLFESIFVPLVVVACGLPSVAHAADTAPTPRASFEDALTATRAAESSLVERALAPNASKKELAAVAVEAASLRAVRTKLLDARDEFDRRADAGASAAELSAFATSQAPLLAEAKATTERAAAPPVIPETATPTVVAAVKSPAAEEKTSAQQRVAKAEAPPPVVVPKSPKKNAEAVSTAPNDPSRPKFVSIAPEPLDVDALEAELAARDEAHTRTAANEAAASEARMSALAANAAAGKQSRDANDLALRDAATRERWRIVRREVGYGGAIGGAGAVVLGAVFYGVALAAQSSVSSGNLATQSDIASAQSRTSAFSSAGVTFVVVGALAAAGGVALILTSKPPPHSVLEGARWQTKPRAFFTPYFEGGQVVW